ncbi:MAG: hypothetical protein HeimC2_19330 [Candidatus Heimdallarchaeota archaeon LC_2]|nr:MAG: hypothetical protein HeimC2_19330 [Candidatus Heimdallarchaeota archaeon LC_2]
MLGDELFISKYDPNWIERFRKGSSQLKKILKYHIIELYHIGSTSIPNLCAKPIIDMILEVQSFNNRYEWIKLLQNAGYRYIDKWNEVMPFRRLFARHANNDFSDKVLEHLHIVEQGHRFVKRHLLFRDFLRLSEKDCKAYCEMKKELVNSGIARKDYNEMKTDFIQSLDRKAHVWKYGKELPSDYYENN